MSHLQKHLPGSPQGQPLRPCPRTPHPAGLHPSVPWQAEPPWLACAPWPATFTGTVNTHLTGVYTLDCWAVTGFVLVTTWPLRLKLSFLEVPLAPGMPHLPGLQSISNTHHMGCAGAAVAGQPLLRGLQSAHSVFQATSLWALSCALVSRHSFTCHGTEPGAGQTAPSKPWSCASACAVIP